MDTIKVTTAANIVTASQNIPFSNTYADANHTWVTEIMWVNFIGVGSASTVFLGRGEVSETVAGVQQSGPLLLALVTVATNVLQQVRFDDGLGNGLIVPENQLNLTSGANESLVHIYYKMRKIRNKDLFIYMANVGSANN